MNVIEMSPSHPSACKPLLELLVGQKIVSIGRVVNCEPEEYVLDKEINANEFFMLTHGQTYISFENDICIGVMYSPSKATLMIWKDNEVDLTSGEPKTKRFDGKIMKAGESDFVSDEIRKVLGRKVDSISIVKLNRNPTVEGMSPFEDGLLFNFEDGDGLVLGAGVVKCESAALTLIPLSFKPLVEEVEIIKIV
ncbi:hypothetical protein [Pleionea sp. CnH1-48]|uniref:hypothetical protein n=1 Tax=Pleionea sp. CnH1-48 TaxID=2954494 RepID=UPI002097BAE4|nr:hypothetical protein [Pleionea sp. CnH1-48]MCO7223669.1 hypothetical protein [Pleionea sp. CnH1-48]